jgi:hypothetical protein
MRGMQDHVLIAVYAQDAVGIARSVDPRWPVG